MRTNDKILTAARLVFRRVVNRCRQERGLSYRRMLEVLDQIEADANQDFAIEVRKINAASRATARSA